MVGSIGASTVRYTRGRVVSALAGLALAATFVGFGVARKQQRLAAQQRR